MEYYDLVIIGSGAAGTSAATAAKHLGTPSVAIVERGLLWGTCINIGCIPSKFLLTLADLQYYKNYHHPSISIDSRFHLNEALGEKQALIERMRQRKFDRIFSHLGIELIEGDAEFISPQELQVGDRLITGKHFIIATGSLPSVPPIDGINAIPFMTNVEALNPDRIPDSLIVIGGRALGLEFAQLYTHLGTRVTLLQRSPQIIPEEEPEIAKLMTEYLIAEGIDIQTNVEVKNVRRTGNDTIVSISVQGIDHEVSAKHLLLATGRTPNTKTLHLERAGVMTGKSGAILVDETMKTTAPNIWAAGDVVGEPQLETAARAGGEIAVINALTERLLRFDRSTLPHGIFTAPQVASVGTTEEQAKHAGLNPESRCLYLDVLAKSAIVGDTRGVVKIVAEETSGRILGIHICAPLATEMIQEGVLAVKHRLTVTDLQETFHVFPTATEVLQACARKFRKKRDDCSDTQ